MQLGLIFSLVALFTFRHWGRNDALLGFLARINVIPDLFRNLTCPIA
jgi:hypothetical protein